MVVRRILLLPLAAAMLALPASAETLYNVDGVQLSASIRLISADAATCRVREERHSTEQYKKLRNNEGQPMSVWRVELIVANYSGKTLDYLNAHLNVRSEWPPCDHWDGLGNYGKPVVWTGPLMTIQDVGSVQPAEERREVEFVLTFEDKPVLGKWDINYDLAPGDVPTTRRTEPELQIDLEQACTQKGVAPCLVETNNRPGCYIWQDELLMKTETVTWSGECSGNLAQGTGKWRTKGTALLHDEEGTYTKVEKGEMRNGKRSGHWTVQSHYSSENWEYTMEGSLLNGNANGCFTSQWTRPVAVHTHLYSNGQFLGFDCNQ